MQIACEEQEFVENFNEREMVDLAIKKYMNRYYPSYDYEIYDAPQYENINGIWYIYFTFRELNSTSSIKMYVQLAMGFLCIDLYYHNTDAIDVDKNHPLSDIRERLKNYLKSILKQIEDINTH